jgi:hypothetical protein
LRLQAEIEQRDRDEPGLEALEQREVDPERARALGRRRISLGRQHVTQRRPLRQQRLGEHDLLLLGGIDVVEIELHDDLVGAREQTVDARGQRIVLAAQHVDGAEQPNLGTVFAFDAPYGRIGSGDDRTEGRQRERGSARDRAQAARAAHAT